MTALFLKPGREKSLLRRHPWIFSGAVERVDGEPGMGETVTVRASGGAFLAWGAYNPRSQIVARVWSWNEREPPSPALLRALLARAIGMRREQLADAQSVRLVHGESDGMPGLVVDRYGAVLVLQVSSAGALRWRDEIADALVALTGTEGVFERSDADVLALEGLAQRVGVLRGAAPQDPLILEEHGLKLALSVQRGHKTGFYLDQRDNRRLARALASGREVLDCFCYTGGFTLNALAGGARRVTAIDSSAEALAAVRDNVQRNSLDAGRVECIEADVFQHLRRLRNEGRRYDLIVLDPPKFAPTAALAERAARGYKDINLLALKLLRPGGLLVTFSCSGGVSRELFQKILAGAAADAGIDAQILRWLAAAPDHPVALNFPEGEYLKGVLCRVPSA
ncbi:MAG TPA: class I SAM-dependent rRNA methyltransferase [Burkholderiales bacterium]|nr:class I SAM-dependent rRNA methyltransferase [Burkholderiales bacterium]